jgi:aminoglycoside phosphotransferase (APT) family kinase protein
VDLVDKTRPVREGEALDLGKLERYLVGRVPGLAGPLAIEQFPAGHSNLTYLVRGGGVELVLRRPPFGSKVKSAHDMGREFRILSRLHPESGPAIYPKAPKPLAHCDDLDVIGAPFYVMERIRGFVLRRTVPAGLEFGPARAHALSTACVDELANLHAIDWRAAGLADLGKPEGYVVRQVTGWTKRYHDAKTDEIPEIDAIATWLAARMEAIAARSEAALIHNDWKYDNLVLDPQDPTTIRGVLDWEMSTIGDPLMDLGTALSYWVDPGDRDELKIFAFGPTHAPGSLDRRALVDRYAARTGRDVSEILFHFCFALFKTAVVAQQIYYRYKQGLTKDERFAMMIVGVRLLSQQAVAAAESGSIAAPDRVRSG